ncbi:MAG: hypothetical protein JWN95_2834 [Frankiales bacterium]|nr:hypothetical protein [Frankiales bacterium]
MSTVDPTPLTVNADRLRADLDDLAQIGRTESGGISRAAYSEADAQSRTWFRQRCQDAGLLVRTDGLANMFITRPAGPGSPCGPAVWTGSHLDTVPNGGRLDGALGALAALECLRRLSELDLPLVRPVSAVVFSDEEGTYGHLLGSGGLVRNYRPEQLDQLTTRDGRSLITALQNWSEQGWAVGLPTSTELAPGTLHAFVELHIEQGPNLDRTGTDIGVVTAIVGLGGGSVEFLGRADHAGTTPMTERQDALLAAADFLTQLPGIAAEIGGGAVATCGVIRVEPGGANVVVERAVVTLDFRHPDLARLVELSRQLAAAAEATAVSFGVAVRWQPAEIVPPVPLAASVQSVIRDAADALGLSHLPLPSGAGHDSQNLARLAPTGMVFVPSKGGRSHSPAEDSDFADVGNGANVLLRTLVTLASRDGA